MATRPAVPKAQTRSARTVAGKAAEPPRSRATAQDAVVLHLPPASDPDHRRAYTREQVANLLQISDRTLTRLINRGEVRTIHIGRRLMISSAEVDRVLRDGASA